ncbi:phosphotransferase [Glycomyces salinus]|uniref:phosphotransferase n=1 Tax=Glycomyces salinus TaxID=980294 RepID=UPI0018ED0A9D|nr:phosphotransferase [Glycomyces salinus]
MHAAFTGTVEAAGQVWFCKATPMADARLSRMLADEARVAALLGSLAPELVAHVEARGWRVLLSEHVPGRHADLSPGSPDLELLAAMVDQLHATAAGLRVDSLPRLVDQWRRASPWRRLQALPHTELPPGIASRLEWAAAGEQGRLSVLEAETLAHTDLHALNILIGGDRVRIVDWAWARAAPPWFDALLFTVRLVDAGHSPADALAWLESTRPGRSLDTTTAAAVLIEATGMWAWLGQRDQSRPHLKAIADDACRLLDHLAHA